LNSFQPASRILGEKSSPNHQSEIAQFSPKYSMSLISKVLASHHFDTSRWHSICDLTLTLKQACRADNGTWIKIDENQCKKAFTVFMHRLDRAAYGSAACRHGKRVKVIPVLEKDKLGRFHFHAAVELPPHLEPVEFDEMIRECWSKVDWGYEQVFVRDKADDGWNYYMLKRRQKSGLETWSDCIVWESLHNPTVDA
jgi:hypothetical protein